VFLVELQAKPGPKAENADGASGAYVNCWVNFALEDGARVLAKYYVEDAGWAVIRIDNVSSVEEEQYEGEESLQYFREAMEDGVSIVYYMYPKDDEG
jgi:hypothetical protein